MPTIRSKSNSDNYSTKMEPCRDRVSLLEQKIVDQSVINTFSRELVHENTIDGIAWAITQNAISKLGFVDCVVYLVDKKNKVLVQKAAHGPKNPSEKIILDELSIPIGEGIVGTVALTGKAEVINNTKEDPRYIQDDQLRLSEIAIPIIYNNEVIGVIDSEHPEKNFYTNYHLEILEAISSMAGSRFASAIATLELECYKNKLEQTVEAKTKDLMEAIEELKRSNTDLEYFAHAVSHDLKEPLRTIGSFTKLIAMKEKSLAPETTEYMSMVHDGIGRMENLLNGLLDYATFHGQAQEKANVNLNELIHHIKEDLFLQITESETTISCLELPTVYGYQTLLKQLFQNLISNAIKFRKPEQPQHISIDYIATTDHYKFSISDNGIGILAENLDKIFMLYSRVMDNIHAQGTGAGLSFCKRIVEKHGGRIWATSDGLDQGTHVHFTLLK